MTIQEVAMMDSGVRVPRPLPIIAGVVAAPLASVCDTTPTVGQHHSPTIMVVDTSHMTTAEMDSTGVRRRVVMVSTGEMETLVVVMQMVSTGETEAVVLSLTISLRGLERWERWAAPIVEASESDNINKTFMFSLLITIIFC